MGNLKLLLCANEEDRDALRWAGYRSVHIAPTVESLFVPTCDGYQIDPRLVIIDRFVLAYPLGWEEVRDAVAMRLGDLKCRWVDWGAEVKGPTELTPEDARSAVEHARPMWTDEICVLSDVPDIGKVKTFATGFARLDKHGTRLIRPAFMTVVGPYSSGKSVLIRQLCCNLWRLHGWRSLITAFEEKIKPKYHHELRRNLIGKNEYSNANGEESWRTKLASAWDEADIIAADEQIERGFRFLRRKRNTLLDGERLLDRIEYAVRVYGLEVVVVDPWNEIDHSIPSGESRTVYMGKLIMRLKQLSDDYNLLMIVLVHPPKDSTAHRSSEYRLMTLNDAADSAHFGNKSDIGWCMWRPTMADDCPSRLHIDKVKDHELLGKPTLAELHLDQGLGRFAVTRIGFDILADDGD